MTIAKIVFTVQYENALCCIEDFFSMSQDLQLVESFWTDHDQVLDVISGPILDGRYRLFFKFFKDANESSIYLTHVIDNR